MPSQKYLIIGLVAVAVVGVIYFASQDRVGDDLPLSDLQRLEQRERQRQADQQAEEIAKSDPNAAIVKLTSEGKGMPLPSHLQVFRDEGGSFIVGQPDSKVAALLPFPPGQFPQPPSDVEPLHENPGFLGASACQECHAETFETFAETAHHLTSRLATPDAIGGSFEEGKNKLSTYHPGVHFEMVQRDDTSFQRATYMGWKFEIPMQIVTGSAKLGQSYLFWNGDELYQSNVTYLKQNDSWINSPGYHDGDAAYDRPISARCMECHTTYVDFREPYNHFTPSSLITGISCERCHGPGRDHVDYHQTNPDDKKSRFVTVPSDLPRDKELQICSQCHSSITPMKGRPFQFRPGDDLIDHYEAPTGESGHSVHTSNQLDRLGRSECFLQTEMTCVDCHNPHRLERGNIGLFSQRCIKCHQPEACGMNDQIGESISDNCIDCHMPIGGSENLRLDTASGSIFPAMRDHYIRVDRTATDLFLNK